MDCSLPGSSDHKTLQAILEREIIPCSRISSWTRDRTWVSCIEGRSFTVWTTFNMFINLLLKSWSVLVIFLLKGQAVIKWVVSIWINCSLHLSCYFAHGYIGCSVQQCVPVPFSSGGEGQGWMSPKTESPRHQNSQVNQTQPHKITPHVRHHPLPPTSHGRSNLRGKCFLDCNSFAWEVEGIRRGNNCFSSPSCFWLAPHKHSASSMPQCYPYQHLGQCFFVVVCMFYRILLGNHWHTIIGTYINLYSLINFDICVPSLNS